MVSVDDASDSDQGSPVPTLICLVIDLEELLFAQSFPQPPVQDPQAVRHARMPQQRHGRPGAEHFTDDEHCPAYGHDGPTVELPTWQEHDALAQEPADSASGPAFLHRSGELGQIAARRLKGR